MFTTLPPPSETRSGAGETGLFIKKSSLIVWKEIMLISQFTRRQLRHADENEAVGGCLTAEQLATGGLLAFCGKFIIIIDGTLFF